MATKSAAKKEKAVSGILVVVAMLVCGTGGMAADSPLQLIRSTVNQVIPVLQDPACQREDHGQACIDKVWKIVEPHFDLQELAKRALGVHWRERTEAQRREFVQLFAALIEKTYSSAIARYATDVQFFFDQERIEDSFAEVDTRLFTPSLKKTIPITYQLHRTGEQWLIHDVVIEHVSLVRNYRTQFNHILSQSSYEDLVQNIKSKLQDLSTTPSSSTS